jgi:hypothetical protein
VNEQVIPWIIIVGGFLGAGKTSLLLAASKELSRRGLKSAVILNDQGDDLVDTSFSTLNGMIEREVTGGCFCCRLTELKSAIDELRQFSPDVIFAEPVGSCTDIAATILHPLSEFTSEVRLAPFTVLVDPERAVELLQASADKHLQFLFEKQLEEADLICFTKSDSVRLPEALSDKFRSYSTRQLSAFGGQGVAAWLDEVMAGKLSAGSNYLDIDYQQYAQAEAALAWLNLSATIVPSLPTSPAALLGPLLEEVDSRLTEAGIRIVHLKALIQSPSGFVKAAICNNGQEPIVEGGLDASPAHRHALLINLRALGNADEVRKTVLDSLTQTDHSINDLEVSCFHPAAPVPERRFVSR